MKLFKQIKYDNQRVRRMSCIFKQSIKQTQIHQSPGIDDPIAMLRDVNGNGRFEANEVFTYTKDHLGSVKDITDSNAELKQRYGYSAYGATKLEKDDTHSSNQFVENPYAYTAREWEQETGCYYYRARWYCPGMLGFISEDPIGFDGQDINKYRYVHGFSLTKIDPYGLRSFDPFEDAESRCVDSNSVEISNINQQIERGKSLLTKLGKTSTCIKTEDRNTELLKIMALVKALEFSRAALQWSVREVCRNQLQRKITE